MPFTLPKLAYGYDALEPFIDAKTMEIHHGKHHQVYADNFNAVIAKYPDLSDKSAEEIIRNSNNLKVDEKDRAAIKNQGGGYLNHNIFWQVMGPKKEPDQKLIEEIAKTFSSLETFKKLFTETAVKHFGSGWAWLVKDENSTLKVYSLPNQDSPLTLGHTPIFCLDVWEHAYYLKYQNRRAEYIENWWNVLKIV